MGWWTYMTAGLVPRATLCAVAADTNSSDATNTDGSPDDSYSARSCKLHDTHDPASAKAWITAVERFGDIDQSDDPAGQVLQARCGRAVAWQRLCRRIQNGQFLHLSPLRWGW